MSELAAMSADALLEELRTLKKNQLNMRFLKASGRLEDTSGVRRLRRSIARIKTRMASISGQADGTGEGG